MRIAWLLAFLVLSPGCTSSAGAAPPPAPATLAGPPPLTPPPHPRPPQRGMQTAGRLWRHRGRDWEQVTDENDDPVSGIWSTPDGREVYVSTWSRVLHLAGDEWRREPVPIRRPQAVWGDGAGKIYISGGGGIASSRGDGVWTREDTRNAFAIAGTGPGDVVAVGHGGVVLTSRGDGRWEAVDARTDTFLQAVAAHEGEIWAGGDNGTVLHRTSAGAWETENVGGDVQIADLLSLDGRLYAVGASGVFERKEGGWTALPVPTQAQLTGLGGGNGSLVVVGLQGTILHRAGEGPLTPVQSTFRDQLGVVHLAGDGSWYFGGEQFYTD
jgi:hypothetical protein